MPIRAAQYLRMSTESQRYSIINQAAAIAAFALQEGYEIVATYEDAGKSGLTFDKREGLKALLVDVVQRKCDFAVVLVLDVSRWGRFQDPDQAAYYEFTCRAAGVNVRYVGEQFDYGPTGSILKQLKRVMAGEYSRELSTKVKQAKRRLQDLGLHQGGPCPFAVAREELTPAGIVVRTLRRGERKSRPENVLRYVHGAPEEIALACRIFDLYVARKKQPAEIARRLSTEGVQWIDEKQITSQHVRRVLACELLTGRLHVGKAEHSLGGPSRALPKSEWRSVMVFEPIISPARFRAAERRRIWLQENRAIPDQDLLDALRRVQPSIGDAPSLEDIRKSRHCPHPSSYEKRFGSVGRALELIGKVPRRNRIGGQLGRPIPEGALVAALQKLSAENGYVSASLIRRSPSTPTVETYLGHFGSLTAAYQKACVSTRTRRGEIVPFPH